MLEKTLRLMPGSTVYVAPACNKDTSLRGSALFFVAVQSAAQGVAPKLDSDEFELKYATIKNGQIDKKLFSEAIDSLAEAARAIPSTSQENCRKATKRQHAGEVSSSNTLDVDGDKGFETKPDVELVVPPFTEICPVLDVGELEYELKNFSDENYRSADLDFSGEDVRMNPEKNRAFLVANYIVRRCPPNFKEEVRTHLASKEIKDIDNYPEAVSSLAVDYRTAWHIVLYQSLLKLDKKLDQGSIQISGLTIGPQTARVIRNFLFRAKNPNAVLTIKDGLLKHIKFDSKHPYEQILLDDTFADFVIESEEARSRKALYRAELELSASDSDEEDILSVYNLASECTLASECAKLEIIVPEKTTESSPDYKVDPRDIAEVLRSAKFGQPIHRKISFTPECCRAGRVALWFYNRLNPVPILRAATNYLEEHAIPYTEAEALVLATEIFWEWIVDLKTHLLKLDPGKKDGGIQILGLYLGPQAARTLRAYMFGETDFSQSNFPLEEPKHFNCDDVTVIPTVVSRALFNLHDRLKPKSKSELTPYEHALSSSLRSGTVLNLVEWFKGFKERSKRECHYKKGIIGIHEPAVDWYDTTLKTALAAIKAEEVRWVGPDDFREEAKNLREETVKKVQGRLKSIGLLLSTPDCFILTNYLIGNQDYEFPGLGQAFGYHFPDRVLTLAT